MRLPLQARIRDGRLVLDEPVDLPNGTAVELMPVSEDDDLDDTDRARLHASLKISSEQFVRGEGIPAVDALRQLRER